MKRYYILLFILASFLCLSLFGQETYLEFLGSIPKEHHNVFFRTIPFIAIDDQGVFYATDNRDQIIYKIDVINDAVKIIGRPGQGPGDLSHPWLTIVEGANLYVADDIGINIFNTNGDFQSRFRIFNKIISFIANKDTIFAAESGTEKLVTCYDKSGKRLSSFGFKYSPAANIYKGWPPAFIDRTINEGKILIGNNAIYFISFAFAELFKYDLAGNLLTRNILAEEDVVKKNRDYYLEVGQARNESGQFNTNRIINDACYFNGKIYILLGVANADKREYEEIIEIDENDMKSRTKMPLKNVKTATSSWGCRNVICGLNKWMPSIFVSLYDDKEEKYLIYIYKKITR